MRLSEVAVRFFPLPPGPAASSSPADAWSLSRDAVIERARTRSAERKRVDIQRSLPRHGTLTP